MSDSICAKASPANAPDNPAGERESGFNSEVNARSGSSDCSQDCASKLARGLCVTAILAGVNPDVAMKVLNASEVTMQDVAHVHEVNGTLIETAKHIHGRIESSLGAVPDDLYSPHDVACVEAAVATSDDEPMSVRIVRGEASRDEIDSLLARTGQPA